MKKSIIQKGLLIFGGTLGALLIVLIIHIYSATHQPKNHLDQVQLSRIDFSEKPDSLEAMRISRFVRGLQGVQSTYFNIPDGVFVYTYSIKDQSSTQVFDQLMASGPYKAHRFMVDPETAKTGCPIIDDQDSFRSRIVTLISKL